MFKLLSFSAICALGLYLSTEVVTEHSCSFGFSNIDMIILLILIMLAWVLGAFTAIETLSSGKK